MESNEVRDSTGRGSVEPSSAVRQTRITWFGWLLVVLCLVVGGSFFLLQVGPLFRKPRVTAIFGWDDTFYYVWLRSAFVGHDVDFADDIIAAPTLPNALKRKILFGPRTDKGLIPNKYAIGWAVSSVPFYLLADGATVAGRALGLTDAPRDGYNHIYQLIILLGHQTYAFAGLFMSFLIIRRFVSSRFAVLGVALTWLTSFMLYYQSLNHSMPHSIAFFWLTLTYYATFRAKECPEHFRYWIVIGIAGGMSVICRYQIAVYMLFPAAFVLGRLQMNRFSLLRVSAAAVCAIGVVFLQMLAWRLLYGDWIRMAYGDETFTWLDPHFAKVLLSPFHGLFYWHPMLFVGAVGFLLALVRRRDIPRTWLAAFLLTMYVNAAWETWWFGASFGSRAFEGCVLFFMLGSAWIVSLLRDRPVAQRAVVALFLLAAIWNLNIAYLTKRNVIRGDQPATYAQMSHATLKHYFIRPPDR